MAGRILITHRHRTFANLWWKSGKLKIFASSEQSENNASNILYMSDNSPSQEEERELENLCFYVAREEALVKNWYLYPSKFPIYGPVGHRTLSYFINMTRISASTTLFTICYNLFPPPFTLARLQKCGSFSHSCSSANLKGIYCDIYCRIYLYNLTTKKLTV